MYNKTRAPRGGAAVAVAGSVNEHKRAQIYSVTPDSYIVFALFFTVYYTRRCYNDTVVQELENRPNRSRLGIPRQEGRIEIFI